jgi:hypothetical protein
VIKGYDVPETPPLDTTVKKLYNNYSRVVNELMGGLANNIFVKFMHCK